MGHKHILNTVGINRMSFYIKKRVGVNARHTTNMRYFNNTKPSLYFTKYMENTKLNIPTWLYVVTHGREEPTNEEANLS